MIYLSRHITDDRGISAICAQSARKEARSSWKVREQGTSKHILRCVAEGTSPQWSSGTGPSETSTDMPSRSYWPCSVTRILGCQWSIRYWAWLELINPWSAIETTFSGHGINLNIRRCGLAMCTCVLWPFDTSCETFDQPCRSHCPQPLWFMCQWQIINKQDH